jgi:hypothetical protein
MIVPHAVARLRAAKALDDCCGTPHAYWIARSHPMEGQRITVVANFATLIAKAGFTKESLARAAGVNRGVIFRALSPEVYGVSGAIRDTSAWKIAQAYAERTKLDRESAFARLFVVTGEQGSPAHRSADVAPADGSVMDRDTPELMPQPSDHEQTAVLSTTLKKTANLRLDAESVAMLDALMQDEDRSSQRDMLRVLIKRAYRALVARRSTTDTPPLEAPKIHKP